MGRSRIEQLERGEGEGGDYWGWCQIEEEEDVAAWRTGGGAAMRRRVPARKFAPP